MNVPVLVGKQGWARENLSFFVGAFASLAASASRKTRDKEPASQARAGVSSDAVAAELRAAYEGVLVAV